MTAAEIAEVLGMALATVSRWLASDRPRASARAWRRPSRPTATSAPAPASWSTSTSRSSGGSGKPGRRPSRAREPAGPVRRLRRAEPGSRLGIRATSASMTPPASPTSRCSPDEKRRDRSRLPAAGGRTGSPRWGSPSSAVIERQRRLLSLRRPCRGLRASSSCGICFTKPYRPRTNGKAERFIQTLSQSLGLWGDLRLLGRARREPCPAGSTHYNFTRRHGSLGHRPPAARLAALEQPHE